MSSLQEHIISLKLSSSSLISLADLVLHGSLFSEAAKLLKVIKQWRKLTKEYRIMRLCLPYELKIV